MEPGTNQHRLGLFIAEASGTAIFLTAIFFTAIFHSNNLTVAIGVGGGLFIAITAFGKETGGHFNPAVSTGYFLCILKERRKYLGNFIILLVAQVFGGLFAGLILFIVSDHVEPVLLPDRNNVKGAVIDEILFTFIFLLVIYCVKSRNVSQTNDGMLGALTVSMTLSLTVVYGGKLSGACYNPAVGIAINLWSAFVNADTYYAEYLYIYIFCPILGGILSGLVVKYFLDLKIRNMLMRSAWVESKDEPNRMDNEKEDYIPPQNIKKNELDETNNA